MMMINGNNRLMMVMMVMMIVVMMSTMMLMMMRIMMSMMIFMYVHVCSCMYICTSSAGTAVRPHEIRYQHGRIDHSIRSLLRLCDPTHHRLHAVLRVCVGGQWIITDYHYYY